ncbi:MAG: transcriptional regulator [Bacillota bacterium]|nr:transcriptional regulator [Bacillota bacterium]
MDIINQTNRCILFEEINPERLDLLTLVGDVKGIDSLDDEKIKEINKELLVRSFDEFLDKFSPSVYSFYNAAADNGKGAVVYTLKRPENIPPEYISEIKLDHNNDFLKMLFTLIETKRSQGIINVDFRFEKVLDMISPKKVMDDIRQARKEIHYLYDKYDELDEGDPKKLDLGDKLNYKFEEARQNYNNVMAMLPLAIEDIKTRLLLGGGDDKGSSQAVQIGMLTIGETGELKIIEAPKEESNALMLASENSNTSLVSIFESDYDDVSDSPSSYVRDLVVRTFCPLPATLTEVDIDKEIANYKAYLEFYTKAKDDFVKASKPLVEKILGVKMFFDQYNSKTRGMRPALLITNNKLDMTVKSSNVPRLETYLNTVNAKNDFSNTVWMGIVPAIELESTGKPKVGKVIFQGNKEVKKEGNTIESLTALLQVMRKYRVQVFFNFQANEETTFNNVATTGVDKYMDKCQLMTRQDYSEFAIPCLPNFTIIPKDKSGVVIDTIIEKTEDGGVRVSNAKEDILKLWIQGVYVDASYVAAGLVAAYQCPEYLKECSFRNTSRNYPGVRFDIEAGDNCLRMVTTMAKEITGFTNNIKDEINKRSFGFVFSSENAQLEGKDIKRITVYKARSLAMTDSGFDSIYKTIVSTYIERILRFTTNDFKQDKIEVFFSNNPSSQKEKWKNDNKFINSVVHPGDDLNFSIDELTNLCQIDLAFNGNVKNLEVLISKSTSAAGAK